MSLLSESKHVIVKDHAWPCDPPLAACLTRWPFPVICISLAAGSTRLLSLQLVYRAKRPSPETKWPPISGFQFYNFLKNYKLNYCFFFCIKCLASGILLQQQKLSKTKVYRWCRLASVRSSCFVEGYHSPSASWRSHVRLMMPRFHGVHKTRP